MALGATRESVYRLMLATIIAPVHDRSRTRLHRKPQHRQKPRIASLRHQTHRPFRDHPGRLHLRRRGSCRYLRTL